MNCSAYNNCAYNEERHFQQASNHVKMNKEPRNGREKGTEEKRETLISWFALLFNIQLK